jgi:hypothetical protein
MPFSLEECLKQMERKEWNRLPLMPVHVAISEAKMLFEVVSKSRESFAAIPDFDPELLEALPAVIQAMEAQECAWQLVRAGRRYRELRTEAKELRSSFIASARYLLRADEAAQAQLDLIEKGRETKGLMGSLGDIAAIAANPQWAARLALDKQLPVDVAAHARDLAAKLLRAKDKSEALETIARRNQCYWLLSQVVGEVRAAGQFLFRDDSKTLSLISSRYDADRKRRNRNKRREREKGDGPAPKPE